MSEYKGWLLSDNLVKRSFSIWGHLIVAEALVLIIILVASVFLSGLIATFVPATLYN